MIVKILAAASNDFQGVVYNDKKIQQGKAEMLIMKNFPTHINPMTGQQEIRTYLQAVSSRSRVKAPQFHAVISSRFQKESKEELIQVGQKFMEEMGYGAQPYMIVFHQDTHSNHIHLVSTRVDKKTGKKIKDNFERVKAQQALQKVARELGLEVESHKSLNRLLQYKYSSIGQLKTLMERSGYKISLASDGNTYRIFKNGVEQKKVTKADLNLNGERDSARIKQIRAILSKYSKSTSNKVFRVDDRRHLNDHINNPLHKGKVKYEYESELQDKMRKLFGIDIVFHHKDDKPPFGYTLIDHKDGTVYKGSEIGKMKEMFLFTDEKIDKRLFEILKDYSVKDAEAKGLLIQFFNQTSQQDDIKPFMIFMNKKDHSQRIIEDTRKQVLAYLKGKTRENPDLWIKKNDDGEIYVLHSRNHYIGELGDLIGQQAYANYKATGQTTTAPQPQSADNLDILSAIGQGLLETTDDLAQAMLWQSATLSDPEEKRRKRKKRKNRW